jgi:hypothetical protein
VISPILLTACSGSRQVEINWLRPKRLFWNEDTVHKYYILMLPDSTFYYTIDKPGRNRKRKISTWRGLYDHSNDTIHLHFQDKRKPPMCDYLIGSYSQIYLIQYFNNNQKKMFLMRQQLAEHIR